MTLWLARFSCTTQLSGTTLLKGPISIEETYALILRALPVVAAMELVGVLFNAGGLPSLIKQWRKRLDETHSQLVTLPLLALCIRAAAHKSLM